MIVTEAEFTPQTGPLPYFIAAATLEVLALQNLAGRLVFHLIVLADVVATKAADKQPATVIPHRPLALETLAVDAGTRAPV